MHLAKPFPLSSRSIMRALLLVALGAASIALTQCRSVSDAVNGVDMIGIMKAKDCLTACQKTAADQLRREHQTNEHNLEACNGNSTCIAQENARDAAAVAAIQAALVACQNTCHQQGAGGN
jgi:hypothetical protein